MKRQDEKPFCGSGSSVANYLLLNDDITCIPCLVRTLVASAIALDA